MIICFLAIKQIIHYEFVPPNKIVTQTEVIYLQFRNIYHSTFLKMDQIFGWTSEFHIMTLHCTFGRASVY